jgi:hypothetical protein
MLKSYLSGREKFQGENERWRPMPNEDNSTSEDRFGRQEYSSRSSLGILAIIVIVIGILGFDVFQTLKNGPQLCARAEIGWLPPFCSTLLLAVCLGPLAPRRQQWRRGVNLHIPQDVAKQRSGVMPILACPDFSRATFG